VPLWRRRVIYVPQVSGSLPLRETDYVIGQ
jgi:hypothetical protein